MNIKKLKDKKVYFVLPSSIITKTIRGTEQFMLETAAYLNKYMDVTVFEPAYNGVNNVKNPILKRNSKYSQIKLGLLKSTKIKLPFGQYMYRFRSLPTDGIVYLPFDFYSQLPNLLLKPKSQVYILGVAHGLHLQNGQLAHHGEIGKFANMIIRVIFALKRTNFQKTIYYHVANEEQRKYLLSTGIKFSNIFKVPYFINTSKFRIASSNSKFLRVLHVGGISKDANFVLAVINKLVEQKKINHYEFHFIGREMPQGLKALNEKHSYITVHGFVDDKIKADIMSNVDVLLVPDIESFSVTMLEGLASGLYVISSDGNPAAFDLKARGASVFIEKYGNTYGYVNALEKIAKLKRIGVDPPKDKNRNIIIKNYSEKVVLKRSLSIFKNIILNSKPKI